MGSRLKVTGVVCLLGASVGSFVQYLVSPISAGDSASAQVAAAAVHPTRMAWAVVLDLPILLLIPALVYVAWLVGARSSWLAAIGTGLTFATAMGAVGYLLALDPLVYAAAQQPRHGPAAELVAGYLGTGLVTGVVIAYLAGHVIGFIVLAVALARARTVPVWAAVALGLWPVVEMAGAAAGVKWLAAAGYGLLVVAFGACAAALLRVDRVRPSDDAGSVASDDAEPASSPAAVPPMAAVEASG
jgi:hypothetical protein